MNKEQSADDPSVDLIRVKNMYTFHSDYPDVQTYYRDIRCLWKRQAIEAALVKHDNNMKDYSLMVVNLITANHSNCLICDRANTQSVTVRKW